MTTKPPSTRAKPASHRAPASHVRLVGGSAQMPDPATSITISSKNYSSWSLRGWLMLKMAGLPFTEVNVDIDAPGARAELLLLAPSILVPCLSHRGIQVWDTLAIGEYLHEIAPRAGLLPADSVQRAHCRSISGEMHSGFSALRSSLPMNIKARFDGFKVWSKARADIERIEDIWQDCLKRHGGPFLFGARPTLADAMFAPVATRFVTYGIALSGPSADYRDTIMALPAMIDWIARAVLEPEEMDELDMDF